MSLISAGSISLDSTFNFLIFPTNVGGGVEGFSQEEGRADMVKNLPASLFNEGLSKIPLSAKSISMDSAFKAWLEFTELFT